MLARGFLLSMLATLTFTSIVRADDWPQWMGPRRDGVWREQAAGELPKDGPTVRWRAPVAGGYAGPAVAAGRVFVVDWTAAPGVERSKDPFERNRKAGSERVLCLNEADGKVLWSHTYDCPYSVSYASGPRCTPTVDGDRVYTLGAEGHLFCLDVKTGKPIWSNRLADDKDMPVPLWGFAAHPFIDGDNLIVLSADPNGVVQALDKKTGEKRWSALKAKEPGYAPPAMYDPGEGAQRQLVIWLPESLNALDPATGKTLWSQPWGPVKFSVSISTPRLWKHKTLGDLLFISSANEGSLMLKLDPAKPTEVTTLWKRSGKRGRSLDGLASLMASPILHGDHIYGCTAGGEFRCIKATDGDIVWESFEPTHGGEDPLMWSTAFLTPLGDTGRCYVVNEKGDLIVVELSPQKYKEVGRAHLLDPTNVDASRPVIWSHPAYADKSMFWKNDKELICVKLGAPEI